MNPIDDMFRKGLDGRPGEVPADMWSRVRAGQAAPAPEGAALDKLFADGLKDHAGQVPAGMWSRIAATGLPAAAAVDQVFVDGLKERSGEVPAGMWGRIWKARTAASGFRAGRWAAAAAAILLLLMAGWWLLPVTETDALAADETETIAEAGAADAVAARAATAKITEEGAGSILSSEDQAQGGDVNTGVNARPPASEASRAGADFGLPPDVANTTTSAPAENSRTTAAAVAGDDVAAATPPPAATMGEGNEAAVEVSRSSGLAEATALLPAGDSPAAIVSAAGPKAIKVKGRYRPQPSNDRAFRAAPRHRFQLELLFGAAYADQQFSPATDADRILSDLRAVSEFPELSHQVSLRAALNLSRRFVFLGGFTYAEIRNQFEYERTVNGETSLLRTNNSLRILEAPLLLGYRMPGRRLQVSLNAGPVVNLSTSARGRFLSPDASEPLDLATDGNYRSNVGVGFMTSLSTTYQIGKKEPFVLLVEPFFKAYPTAFTTRAAPVKESYWVAGLQLGVRKGF